MVAYERAVDAAERWVEEHFPGVSSREKASLFLAYGAGFGAGLDEAYVLLLGLTGGETMSKPSADVKLEGKDPGGKLNGILGRGSDPKNK